MRISKILLPAFFLALLAGCDVADELQEGIDQANRIGDPYEAAKVLQSVARRTYESPRAMSTGDSKRVQKLSAQVKKSQEELMIRAIEIGDTRAVVDVFGFYSPDELRRLAVPALFEQAEKPNADNYFLVIAGRIAYEGKYTQTDYTRALSYFVRAWLKGSEYAADGAKTLFAQLEDNENAYLWSLRCMSHCNWDNTKPIKSPSTRRVLEIQRLALEKHILVLGDSPLSSVLVKP